MQIRSIPLRTGLIFTILLMGAISIALLIASQVMYRDHAIETQHNAVLNLVRLKSNDLLTELQRNAGKLGLEIQHEPTFRTAFRARDIEAMQRLMNDRFNQYFVTADILELLRIEAWDSNFIRIASASNGVELPAPDAGCPDPASVAAGRSGSARLRPVVTRCTAGNAPYMSVAVPVGLLPEGYINIVVDPLHDLEQLETSLGLPLHLARPDGTTRYRSAGWDIDADDIESVTVSYPVSGDHGDDILLATTRVDISTFIEKLVHTRNNFMLIAGIVTILTVMLAYLLTELIIVQPLQTICNRLKNPHLYAGADDDLDPEFISEYGELRELYTILEDHSSTDRLTGLANRIECEKQLKHLRAPKADPAREHALCYLDLDHFKEIIDDYGHTAGAELLIQVTRLLLSAVDKDDLVARIDGDEFALLLKDCTLEDIQRTITKFNDGVKNLNFIWNGKRLVIAVSAGIVRFSRDTDIDNILGTAHTCCYLAKDNPDMNVYFYRIEDEPGTRH